MGWQERISANPAVRTGKPCIKGTRITAYDVLEYLADGMSEDEILRDFPGLTHEDIRAALAFAHPAEIAEVENRTKSEAKRFSCDKRFACAEAQRSPKDLE